ncbi:arylsulfatase regulator [Mucinivorans hirudinis]|uniref:Arylsulfatase regulator n=2 Tax=Mucinivorans hirudinis TaxID=1433126 RepID=A0A060RBK3_9BACT|nr:arylsulfatase regulator [Mucinivorans hirudinis]
MFHFVALKGNEMKQTLKQQLTITREQRNKYYLKQIQKLSEEREVLYSDVIKPILKNIKAITSANNIDINSGMTTNGYLINSDMLAFLKKHNHRNFQITLDGNKERHNRVRYSKNDHNTFDVIVNNIKNCIKNQFYVSVRLNISSNTNIDVEELLRDFISLSEIERSFLCFSIHKVWQEPDEVEVIVDDTKEKIRLMGFNAVTYHSNPTTIKNTCYADKTNHVTINPKGLIYKCTARDFTKENIEGYLLRNGVIKWEPIYYIRKDVSILMRDSCRECQILPICNGGCSQKKIENRDNKCLYNFDAKSKLEFAKKIIYSKILQQ